MRQPVPAVFGWADGSRVLDWYQCRCAAVAEVLRTQRVGWKKAMVRAIGGTEADSGGA